MGNSRSQLPPSIRATNSAPKKILQKLEQIPRVEERSALFHLEAGQNAQRQKEWRLALEHYALGLSCAPKEPRTLYLLYNNGAHCRNMLGLYAEAEQYSRLAIKTDSKRHEAYINLGISLEGQRDVTGAAWCFVKALKAQCLQPTGRRASSAVADRLSHLSDTKPLDSAGAGSPGARLEIVCLGDADYKTAS